MIPKHLNLVQGIIIIIIIIKIFNKGWQSATNTNVKGDKTIYKIDKCPSSYGRIVNVVKMLVNIIEH